MLFRKLDHVLIAVTGASGAIYAEHCIAELLPVVLKLSVVCSVVAKTVIRYELKSHNNGFSLVRLLNRLLFKEEEQKIDYFDSLDYFSPIASGSNAPDAMIVLPCSMGSLARICHGVSSSLIERVADVCLKQKSSLIICPRETPFSVIHLENMLKLAKLGVHIVPPIPAFYQKPKNITDLVRFHTGRIFELLHIEHELYPSWKGRIADLSK